jgi:hypothetical protein
MKPMKADYMQTYVSQHVPPPFKLMQRAAENKQAEYDAIAKNMEAQRAYLGKLKAYRDKDTETLGGKTKAYQDELNNIMEMNGGDLTAGEAEARVRQLGQVMGQDYQSGELGELVQGYQIQKDFEELQRDREKASKTHSAVDLAFGGIVSEQYARDGGGINDMATIVAEGWTEKEDQALKKATKESLVDRKIEYDANGKAAGSRGGYEGVVGGYYAQFTKGEKGISFQRAYQANVEDLSNSSGHVETVKRRLAIEHYNQLSDEEKATAKITDIHDNIPQSEINEVIHAEAGAQAMRYAGYEEDLVWRNAPQFAAAEQNAINPITNVTLATQSELLGVQDTVDSASMAAAIKTSETQYMNEATKLINSESIGGFEAVGLSNNPSFTDVFTKLNNPTTRDKLKKALSPDAFDALDNLSHAYENQVARKNEIESRVTERMPEASATKKAIEKDMAALGLSPSQFSSVISGLYSGPTNIITSVGMKLLNQKEDELNKYYGISGSRMSQYSGLIKTPSDLTRRFAEDGPNSPMAKADPEYYKEAKAWADASNSIKKNVSKYREYQTRYSAALDKEYKESAKGFVKTSSGNTTFPQYSYVQGNDGKMHLTYDQAASDKQTKAIRELFTDNNIQTLSSVKVKAMGGEQASKKDLTFGEVLKAYSDGHDGANPDVGLPLLSRSFGSDGRRFLSVNVDGTEYHMPITNTSFTNLRQSLQKPVSLQNNDGTTTEVYPYKVDQYLFEAVNSGRSNYEIPGGTVKIPRNLKSGEQNGAYTFFNDSNFKINLDAVKDTSGKVIEKPMTLTGEAAYEYLLRAEGDGQL